MWERLILNIKISSLSCKIKSMEKDIMSYRMDMKIINDLYYAGRGDVQKHTDEWCNFVYWKIAACHRLMERFEKQLDKLNMVVGGNSCSKKI